MATRVADLLMGGLGQLRYEPIDKRIRGMVAGQLVVDTRRAVLVWEPKRVVPSYAVPAVELKEALGASVESARDLSSPQDGETGVTAPRLGDRPVYDPSVPFAVHTTEGETLDIYVEGIERRAAAFRLRDEVLDGYVLLDFSAFDAWYEEDELNVSHPRDPFHRIEVVHSLREVRIERNGQLLAETANPYLLFESLLPVRYYLPAQDVVPELLRPSSTRTACAYKGEASYLSHDAEEDIAWHYPEPLREAAEVRGRVAFFNERVDLVVDGERAERPITPWSR